MTKYLLVFAFGFCLPFLDTMSGPTWHGWLVHSFFGLVVVMACHFICHTYDERQ